MLSDAAVATRDRVTDIVVQIIERRSGKKPDLTVDDLRKVGFSSLDMVNLMLAVEAEFDVKIPDEEMTPQNFRSIAAIDTLISTLRRN